MQAQSVRVVTTNNFATEGGVGEHMALKFTQTERQ